MKNSARCSVFSKGAARAWRAAVTKILRICARNKMHVWLLSDFALFELVDVARACANAFMDVLSCNCTTSVDAVSVCRFFWDES